MWETAGRRRMREHLGIMIMIMETLQAGVDPPVRPTAAVSVELQGSPSGLDVAGTSLS